MTTDSKRTPPSAEPAGSAADRHRTVVEHLTLHPGYLELLRSRLTDVCRDFEQRRHDVRAAIKATLTMLAEDDSADEATRRELMRLFEKLLAELRAMETAAPSTERAALQMLDQLDSKARSARS